MNRWGIGLSVGFVTLSYGLPAAYLTLQFPGRLAINRIPYEVQAIFGLLLGLLGAMTYASSLHRLNEGLRRSVLVTTGPYAVVRHPVYASWMFILLPATALLLKSWLLLAAPAVAYAAFRILVSKEENTLESMFGETYRQYKRTVPGLFPAFRHLRIQNREVE